MDMVGYPSGGVSTLKFPQASWRIAVAAGPDLVVYIISSYNLRGITEVTVKCILNVRYF